MELIAVNHSSYPRVGDGLEQQRLRQACAKLERKEISNKEFERAQDEVTREVMEEQADAGLDIVTDGQIRWHDPLSHIARNLDGCEINGLLRFFDTNFYFRQPVVKGKLSRRESILKEFKFAQGVTSKPLKAVITGPYTLAKLSINRRGADFETIVMELADVIAQEIKDLAKAGAEMIQVEEPAILKNPKDFKILGGAIEKIVAKRGRAEIALCTYFGDAVPLYEKLDKLPVDTVGYDLTYSVKLPDVIAQKGCDKNICLGIIDGRNTKMEKNEEVLPLLKQVLPKVSGDRVYLSPSCGLGDYLPREVAFEKLQALVEITKEARGLM